MFSEIPDLCGFPSFLELLAFICRCCLSVSVDMMYWCTQSGRGKRKHGRELSVQWRNQSLAAWSSESEQDSAQRVSWLVFPSPGSTLVSLPAWLHQQLQPLVEFDGMSRGPKCLEATQAFLRVFKANKPFCQHSSKALTITSGCWLSKEPTSQQCIQQVFGLSFAL